MTYQNWLGFVIILTWLAHQSNCASSSKYDFLIQTNGLPCSVFCMYEVNQNANMKSMCTAASAPGVNGDCNDCDQLLFRPIPASPFSCIAHQYNGQFLDAQNVPVGFDLGWTPGWSNNKHWIVSALTPHFALRLRFGVEYINNLVPTYYYPMSYSIDTTIYNYLQDMRAYWSSYEIITSSLTNHTAANCTVSFSYTNNSAYAGSDRYIHIRDILLFSSHCQVGCLSCSSQTYCMICDYPNLYYLNPADHLCYLTCPQATYPNSTGIYFVNNPATLFEFWCLPCNATCLECSSPTVCYRCYTLGRNESFLYNNTCVNPCPLNYARNYTNHTCDCSYNNFYEILATLTCLPCALECLHCTGPTNRECSACMPDYFLSYGTTFCLNDCPAGQFKDMATNRCSNCDTSCGSCDLVSTRCTECYFTSGGTVIMYLLGAECLSWCPPGYAWNNVTHVCDMCALYTFSYFGKCVKYCPTLYQWNEANRSCLHLSLTDFTFNLSIASIDIVPHGKLIKFTILVQDGLNNNSLNFILKQSYFLVQILYFNSQSITFTGIRSLQQINLPIRNVQYSDNYITYYTNIPDLNYQKSFQIVFMQTLTSSSEIDYGNITAIVPISQNPNIIKQYFTYCVRNYYNVIVIPLIMLIFLGILFQLKGVYQLLIQFLRVVQILGLLVYSSFPIKQFIFSFLTGCSYSNLDFIPNLYALFAQSQQRNIFASYFLMTDNMDFIRLNGSIIFTILIWLALYLVFKYIFSFRESRLNFMITFGFDLLEVKILHSFWSALLYVIVNYKATDLSIYITFAFGFVFFTAVVARQITIWRQTDEINPFFFWRLFSTLLICFVSLGNQIIINLIFLLSIIIVAWYFYLIHTHKLLTSVLYLDSGNYMDQITFKVIGHYEKDVKYAFAVSIRNTVLTILPLLTTILIAANILLKEYQINVIIADTTVLYSLFIFVVVIVVLVYKFLEERRQYLVQSKLQYLQRKFSKIQLKNISGNQERKRPRLDSSKINDSDVFFSAINRSMIKSFD